MKKISLLLILLFLFLISSAQDRIIDYRYAPAYYHTPIGFVDDWQKTMVNERGALLYDFGPGPYVRPNTIVGVGIKGVELKPTAQRLERADIPIVMTNLSGSGVTVTAHSFALVPRQSQTAKSSIGKSRVHRRLGLNGALSWANPAGNVDPAFRNVAWGTNRPIVYDIDVEKGSRKRVAVGICESYRTTPGLRAMEFHIEGAAEKTVDPLTVGTRNQPLIFFFDAEDVNKDGLLRIDARPSASCKDPNVILNGIWLFPERSAVREEEVINGSATKQAEVYVDCGQEPDLQNMHTRIDALLATADNPSGPLLITLQTMRRLTFDAKSGVLKFDGRPFVVSRPKAVAAKQTEKGWELELPKGTPKAEVIVIHGYRLPPRITNVPDLMKERVRTANWWKNDTRLPFGRIAIPDSQMQHLVDASIRTLYQNRDIIDGFPQFQPGSTVYRGLWIHDGVYYTELAAALGDTQSARLAVEQLFQFQEPNGLVRVMWPIIMQRETPLLVWVAERYARLSNTPDWLRKHWERITAAMKYVQHLRAQTLTDSSLAYYGLMPPGFVDGGIAGLTADFSTVYWALLGIRSGIAMAKWLGKNSEREEWTILYDQLHNSFRRAARRDMRRDKFGNFYLPLRVADTTTTDVPQRAQWAICEPIFLSSIFPPNDSLADGSLAVIDSTCVQGLPSSFGWMTGCIGVWFAPVYGMAHLARGNTERAIDVLYAFANHATPHGAWAEEQMPKGVSARTTGDYPTTSATAGMLRAVLAHFVYEDDGKIKALRGLPKEWLVPGAVVGVKDLRTTAGHISCEAFVSKDGRTAKLTLRSVPFGDADDAMAQYTDSTHPLELYLSAFKAHGYKDANGKVLSDRMQIAWGKDLTLEFQR